MTANCLCSAPSLDDGRRNVAACRTPVAALPSEYIPFSLEYVRPYRALYASMPVRTLAFSLPNLWAWRDYIGLEIRFAHGLAWLRRMKRGVHILAPAGPWDQIDWSALQAELLDAGEIYRVPEYLAGIWQKHLTCRMDVIENRDFWEYVYKAEDLATLVGKRYHMQRNHVNTYVREHGEPDLRPLGPGDTSAMLELASRWHAEREVTDSTRAEIESLRRIRKQWDHLDLTAEGLFLENRLAAFAVGHDLDESTMAVLYEKAEPGLRGAFPVMTSSFARLAVEQGKTYVNRAEDMGEEGMRKSKMLYRPVDFQRMCIVRFHN
ncbi:MAG: phosphatidylglycerol lysyltransferase domain-containing protein [Desulfovibrio sp.]|nr:phosphatidylglycerol lysyltransferase domain-containing protein [Desulfovibrio sp.]